MSVSITVSGATLADALKALAAHGGEAAATDAPDTLAGLEPTGKKPGRPAKGKSAAESMADLGFEPAEKKDVDKPATPKFTNEQVVAKLKELMAERTGDANAEAGRERVVLALSKVGLKTVRDVKPEHHAPLMEICDKI